MMWIYDFNSINIILETRPQDISEILFLHGHHTDRITKIENLANQKQVLINWKQKEDFTELIPNTANKNTRILANIKEKSLEDEKTLKKLNNEKSLILILDQITDSRNFGAIIRSASAFGVDKIIIQKLKSPTITPEVYNTSAGTLELIDIVAVTNISKSISLLQNIGYWIYGYDLKTDKTIYQTEFSPKSAFVLGNEQLGMRELVQKSCDFLVKIPMKNNVNSLNVSVSAGIAVFEYSRQINN